MAQRGSLCSESETLAHVVSLLEAFRAFDADNDGLITGAELGGIMGSLGYNPSQEEVRAMMQQGDTNRDGLLSLDEFLEMNTGGMEIGNVANLLRNAFEVFRDDGEEEVTAEGLFEVLGNIGIELPMEDCQNVIASLDANGDGAVGLEDFELLVNSLL